MISEQDFLPKSLDECVISDIHSRDTLHHVVTNRTPFPAFGKCGILLHGPYGTGKTTTAHLLPELMEQARGGSDADYRFHRCAQGTNGAVLMTTIQTATSFLTVNASGLHYTILDEVDNLTDAAQASLKAIMNSLHGVFILTTNHLTAVDKGVVNRCHVIHMLAARPQDWIPLVSRVIEAYGSPVPPASTLIPVIDQCSGSARDILCAAIQIAAHHHTAMRRG